MVQQFDDGVLEAEVRGRLCFEVGVNALCVRIDDGLGLLRLHLVLSVRETAPPECSDERIGFELGISEHLRQSPVGDVSPEVHLEEPVLCVDISLCDEQVVGSIGIDMGDTHRIPNHLNLTIETSDLDRSLSLWECSRNRVSGEKSSCNDDKDEDTER